MIEDQELKDKTTLFCPLIGKVCIQKHCPFFISGIERKSSVRYSKYFEHWTRDYYKMEKCEKYDVYFKYEYDSSKTEKWTQERWGGD